MEEERGDIIIALRSAVEAERQAARVVRQVDSWTRSPVVDLTSMVVNDVEHDADTSLIERLHMFRNSRCRLSSLRVLAYWACGAKKFKGM